MRGNRTNHPRKFARDTDLQELKEQVIKLRDNDLMGIRHKVCFISLKLNFLMGFVALILALLAILVVKVI